MFQINTSQFLAVQFQDNMIIVRAFEQAIRTSSTQSAHPTQTMSSKSAPVVQASSGMGAPLLRFYQRVLQVSKSAVPGAFPFSGRPECSLKCPHDGRPGTNRRAPREC